MSEKIIRPLAESGRIRIGWFVERTTCLGPFSRTALWLQGCCRNCEGCIAPDMQPLSAGRMLYVDELAAMITSTDTEGITISGGEPFYQADKLVSLMRAVKKMKPDYGVILYSGYTFEELLKSGEPEILELLSDFTDLLIDGEYISELDDDRGIRGSSNQRLIFLTNRYAASEQSLENGQARRVDFFLRENNLVQMVGVPSKVAKRTIGKVNRTVGTIAARKIHSSEE